MIRDRRTAVQEAEPSRKSPEPLLERMPKVPKSTIFISTQTLFISCNIVILSGILYLELRRTVTMNNLPHAAYTLPKPATITATLHNAGQNLHPVSLYRHTVRPGGSTVVVVLRLPAVKTAAGRESILAVRRRDSPWLSVS